jgi:Secretion system C-terminal sorting domain
MKHILLSLLMLLCIKSYSQVIANPTIGQISFTSISGISIDDTLAKDYVARLNVPIENLNAASVLPAGTCKIKIGLGSKLIVQPGFNLTIVSTSQYFQWTSELNSGQVQITGDLIADLPANYSDVAKFNIQGSVLGYSTTTANFLITNHNSTVILSDEDPSNNSSFRYYKVIEPIVTPVNFTSLLAVNNNCNISVSFGTENEVNVSHYDIETSKDGSSFTKTGSLTAANLRTYQFLFPITASIASGNLYIRIKSVDRDGLYKYSITKTVNAICSKGLSFSIYPNPVRNTNLVTVKVSGGVLNGKYQATLYDAAGKFISGRTMMLNSLQQFEYPLANIAAGRYLLKLVSDNNEAPVVLKIQKL